ncbi:hypothetical protein SCHPADRAFT_1001300 [Schizopora paradoxa]|uniref:Uncharacterized protein n=1 Tax=Schizopora paradoxa TaxID=27342 RepID=A0A0H2R7W6_9AGAM|nr:hypothetical protein SCHPADRAFT_1001300 [Schizopora paradoxa]
MPTAVASTAKSTKRKSDASTADSSKKRKSSSESHAAAKALVKIILANPESYEPPANDSEALRVTFVELAEYARSLEGQVAQSASNGKAAATKTPEQICAEAERLANTVNSGIKKQMSWKPSCKTGSAKFSFDGFCPDPNVFGALFNLEGPPKFKAKKFPKDEIQEYIGDVVGSVRYDYLYITSDVNVRWNPDTGEFKFSGSYGKRSS